MSRFHTKLVSHECSNKQTWIYRTVLANARGPEIDFILQLFIKIGLKGKERFYKYKKLFAGILFSNNVGLQLETWTSSLVIKDFTYFTRDLMLDLITD